VTGEVRAAGGVLMRDGRVAVVHRPRYDDWAFPKGKLDPGENFAQAALREVQEETGLRGELGRELTSTRYEDAEGRPKVVRYFEMVPVAGEFEPNDEVDELRWLDPAEAASLVTYDTDRKVLEALSSGS